MKLCLRILQRNCSALSRTFAGRARITEENIGEALREIRVALLEADVNLNVVKELVEHIRAKAVGTRGDDGAVADRAGHQDRAR